MEGGPDWIPVVSMARRFKENLPGGSLKYLFVYFKIPLLKCSILYDDDDDDMFFFVHCW